jgi:CRISPR system Cascade subunit CasE
MYLSRLILDPRSRQVRRDLADCQQLHRTVMSAFPQAPEGKDVRARFGVLHRIEVGRESGDVALLVQSQERPDWGRLPSGYLLEAADNPACKPLSQLYEGIGQGARLLFRLRANPSRKIDTKTGPDGRRRNGKRVEYRLEADQLAWLKRRGEQQDGFELLSVRLAPGVADVSTAPGKVLGGRRAGSDVASAQAERLTFGAVVFEGRLRVTDKERFLAALANGIGPGKAYGLGLLSVAPFG